MEILTKLKLIDESIQEVTKNYLLYKDKKVSHKFKVKLFEEINATLSLCKYLYYNCDVDQETILLEYFNKTEMIFSKVSTWRAETSLIKIDINIYHFSLN